jgi:hypothetical protein
MKSIGTLGAEVAAPGVCHDCVASRSKGADDSHAHSSHGGRQHDRREDATSDWFQSEVMIWDIKAMDFAVKWPLRTFSRQPS